MNYYAAAVILLLVLVLGVCAMVEWQISKMNKGRGIEKESDEIYRATKE